MHAGFACRTTAAYSRPAQPPVSSFATSFESTTWLFGGAVTFTGSFQSRNCRPP